MPMPDVQAPLALLRQALGDPAPNSGPGSGARHQRDRRHLEQRGQKCGMPGCRCGLGGCRPGVRQRGAGRAGARWLAGSSLSIDPVP